MKYLMVRRGAILLLLSCLLVTSNHPPEIERTILIDSDDADIYIYIPADYRYIEKSESIAITSPFKQPLEPEVVSPEKPIEAAPSEGEGVLTTPPSSTKPLPPLFDKKNKYLLPSNIKAGDKLYLRIFKLERKLEIWYQRGNQPYRWLKSYDICAFSGGLGPKKKMGDSKSPEGFYETSLADLNPNSRYHRSFNIGFPNQYDREHGYTGNYLMIHGDCVSNGCYAMTDKMILEIYQLVEFALMHGQHQIPIHIFPFVMNQYNLQRYQRSRHADFWNELKPAYELFQQQFRLPTISVKNKKYLID